MSRNLFIIGDRKLVETALAAMLAIASTSCGNKTEPAATQSTSGPLTATLVGPVDGVGSAATFTAKYDAPKGAGSIAAADIIINETLSAAHACYVHYDGATHQITLMEDDKTAWMQATPIGSSGSVQNSQCSIDAAQSSFTSAGNTLTLKAAVSFKPAFVGAKKIFVYASDQNGGKTDFAPEGQWRVVQAHS
jgi:hypothetical protein